MRSNISLRSASLVFGSRRSPFPSFCFMMPPFISFPRTSPRLDVFLPEGVTMRRLARSSDANRWSSFREPREDITSNLVGRLTKVAEHRRLCEKINEWSMGASPLFAVTDQKARPRCQHPG